MPIDAPAVSLSTLIAASPLLGHQLEDRELIQAGQDPELVAHFTAAASRPLSSWAQRGQFVVAPLDLLVSCDNPAGPGPRDDLRVHLLEMNGTGIGGVTNLPRACIDAVLGSLRETASFVADPAGLVVVAVSGKEREDAPRANRLIHEKLLFVDALRDGLERQFGSADVRSLDQLAAERGGLRPARPTVVIGYIKDLLRAARLGDDGCVRIHGRRLAAAVNDRFCGNLIQQFSGGVDIDSFLPVNRCYTAGSDKGVAYRMVTSFAEREGRGLGVLPMHHAHAHSREQLVELVCEWLRLGRQTVIKPHGTGLGHGIEFFLDPAEPRESVARRVDASLTQTAEYYDAPGGTLPYTLCDYVDACRVVDQRHPLAGHRFELRVVVYRDGGMLRAVPSIAKVARERADCGPLERRSLINNITATGDTAKVCGTDYVLPLCRPATLTALGLSVDELTHVCRFAVGLVGHTLDRWAVEPSAFDLVPGEPWVPAGTRRESA